MHVFYLCMQTISMATGGDPSAALQDETTCSICLDCFQDPLMLIDCGHNFCRACITRYSGGGGDAGVSCCPQCRKPFSWGHLRANRHLGNVAELIQQLRLQQQSEAEGAQKVCWKHKEVCKLFCPEDRALISLMCKESPAHKTHGALPIDQAVQDYQDQIQNHITILNTERDEILNRKINNEKVIKEMVKSIISIREQKELAFPKGKVHTLLALLRDVEGKSVQMADENASDALEHSSHLTQLIREMEAKCQQPAIEFLQDIGVFLSKCEREMAKKPKDELRMTADFILQKLLLVQHEVFPLQWGKSSRLVQSCLLSIQTGLYKFVYDSPGATQEKRHSEFPVLVESNQTMDESKSKRVQGSGSTQKKDQSKVKPSLPEIPKFFSAHLPPVTQAFLKLNQMPSGHMQLSTADLHRSEAAGSLGSLCTAIRDNWQFITVLSCEENSLLNTVTLCSRRFYSNLVLSPPEPLILAPVIDSLTFDAETAHPCLVVSRSCKSVWWGGDIQQDLLPGTKRFDRSRCLLSSQGFTSGHHSWVVEVVKEGPWAIGVALESVPRKKSVDFIPREGIWAMAFSNSRYLIHTSPASPLTLSSVPKVIQVYLHYENGQVVFMDFYRKTVLCAFRSTSFSGQKVRAFFRVGGPPSYLRLCCTSYLARLHFP